MFGGTSRGRARVDSYVNPLAVNRHGYADPGNDFGEELGVRVVGHYRRFIGYVKHQVVGVVEELCGEFGGTFDHVVFVEGFGQGGNVVYMYVE